MVAQQISYNKNSHNIELKNDSKEYKKDEGKNYITSFYDCLLFFNFNMCQLYCLKFISHGCALFFMFTEEVEYVNGNFAPSHLEQLYLAQFSHELSEENTSNKGSVR